MTLLTNILVLNTIVNQIPDNKIKSIVFAFILPLLIGIRMSLAPGIYLITIVIDRNQRLRYLMNFIGMRSISYFTGIVIADLIIFNHFGYVRYVYSRFRTLQRRSFGWIHLNYDSFQALIYINLLNFLGFTMKNSDKAYK
jgi:hypothetical protein